MEERPFELQKGEEDCFEAITVIIFQIVQNPLCPQYVSPAAIEN